MSDPALLPECEALLLLNAGTASLKAAIFETDGGMPGQQPVWSGGVTGIGRIPCAWHDSEGGDADLATADDPDPFLAAFSHLLARALAWLGDQPLRAIGYRFPQGGATTGEPLLIDTATLAVLQRAAPSAPACQRDLLRVAGMLAARWPGVPQVASFDTWFHRTLPLAERMLPLPRRYWDAGLRRDGCHGLSYDALATMLPRRFGRRAHGRVVAAHLGHTASLCGMLRLRSSAVSQGLTDMDGLMTGTGAGLLPPAALRRLLGETGAARLAAVLDEEAGLLGVSGVSADPEVLRQQEAGTDAAGLALTLHARQIAREVGALAALLGGLDMLVFTGGIGTHHAAVRARVCALLAGLGVRIDARRNERGADCISVAGSRVVVAVQAAREEWAMARDCMLLTAPEGMPRASDGAALRYLAQP